MVASERISGANGSYLLDTTTSPGGSVSSAKFTSFYVRTDTTITSMTGVKLDGTSVNLRTTLNILNSTLLQGDFYCVPSDTFITSVTLTSGSIILY